MVSGELARLGTWQLEFTLGVAYVVVLGGFLATGSFLRKGEGDERTPETVASVATIAQRVGGFSSEHGLTAREEEVLGHLLRGKSTAAIAADIFLSKNTVRTHVSHIYQKAGVHGRDELVELVERYSQAN